MSEPLKTINSGTVCFVDDAETGDVVCKENVNIELYPHWVKISRPMPMWIPREGVEQIHEY